MAVVNVFQQYFRAEHTFNGVPRHAALVMLIADSEAGHIRYEAAATFFPHNDPEDFAVAYDDYHAVVLFDAPGRRSAKREEKLLSQLRGALEEALREQEAVIFWDRPLGEARRG